ncbi:hypothetical protein COJ23_22230 [Priestia megaterium]|uniref:hypothetical protein n=1 Tax=Priestia megaterium TaxID=1404 RepID=UPI000BF9244E|nr:hypothetical protein [Priestia megaterium]PFK46724.1 hypothetical protein COJ23_22230 [Priestia megaterium]
MDEDYQLGVTIKGEFYSVKINESPIEISSTDPPYVGHTQETIKVSFTEYSDGQLIILSERWGNHVQDIKKVGEIPNHLLKEIMKKIP